jgi:4-diphosphocytidyl-2-C-methyl-D-erythritol kinase
LGADAAGAFQIDAPAKVNLFLHVVGRRADGYHELESLFVFTHLGDRLTATAAPDLSLAITGPFGGALAAGQGNLVLRAAESLRQVAGRSLGAQLTLEKNRPVAAGIGGGSADAAAALRLLNRLWGLGFGPRALSSIGLALGADVPACLAGRPALVRGVGEQITPMPAPPPIHLLLVNPGVPLATVDVFRRRSGPFAEGGMVPMTVTSTVASTAAAFAAALSRCRNDLEPAAVQLVPAISAVLTSLAAAPGCLLARMSGSGASCFGLFGDAGAAKKAAEILRAAHPDWWVAATSIRRAPPAPRPVFAAT